MSWYYLNVYLGSRKAVAFRNGVPVNSAVPIPAERHTNSIHDTVSQFVVGYRRRPGEWTGGLAVKRFNDRRREKVVLQVGCRPKGGAAGDRFRPGNQEAPRRPVGNAAERFEGAELGGLVVDLAHEGVLRRPEDADVVGARQVADGVVAGRLDVARDLCAERH